MLHPEHGTVVINVHGGRISSAYDFLSLIRTDPGFDRSSDHGESVLKIINSYTSTILEGHKGGCCFSLSTIHQDNIIIVITRRILELLAINTLKRDMKVWIWMHTPYLCLSAFSTVIEQIIANMYFAERGLYHKGSYVPYLSTCTIKSLCHRVQASSFWTNCPLILLQCSHVH